MAFRKRPRELLSESGPGRGDRWATKGEGSASLNVVRRGWKGDKCVCARVCCEGGSVGNWEWLRVVEGLKFGTACSTCIGDG